MKTTTTTTNCNLSVRLATMADGHTEKSFAVVAVATTIGRAGNESKRVVKAYFPKSQVTEVDGYIDCPAWLLTAKRRDLGEDGATSVKFAGEGLE